jgi:hypothetical protein
MKSSVLGKSIAAALAFAILALSVACVYPERGYWRGSGWRGPGYFHRT